MTVSITGYLLMMSIMFGLGLFVGKVGLNNMFDIEVDFESKFKNVSDKLVNLLFGNEGTKKDSLGK
ncbi:hypothetical protein [Companilactobacillus metriopterae]|uniref:hypothetical protein n=1 Tax=Companilactobacillus metriopterae TaxID=1909267 RepID=UPI00100AB53E|nr:hypothetical protein [Companilactobacillus metriopterae]